jgi:AcrR family transcriptional regulator
MSRSASYHHGDLRRALLSAALTLVAERGLDGFTLREVARRAGVSHAAPYHHFADRAALVAALVEVGFQELGTALQAAGEGWEGAPLVRLQRIGMAYVQYAVEHPTTFRLLFRPELRLPVAPLGEAPMPDRPDLATAVQAGLAVYHLLRDAVQACQAAGLVAGDTETLALTAWCAVHGLSTLLVDGPLGAQAGTTDRAVELARDLTAVVGLGLLKRE